MPMIACPKCGTQIPDQVIICWHCGYCLNDKIRTLAANQRRNKKEEI